MRGRICRPREVGVCLLGALALSAPLNAQPCDPSWTAMGSGVSSVVRAFTLFDFDQAGPQEPLLVVGGFFTTAGGTPAGRVATWNGSNWAALGLGMNSEIRAFAEFDEDLGGPNPPRLFAAGFFTLADGLPCNHVARWNGAAWTDVGGGVGGFSDATATSLVVFDDDDAGPNPPALYVGGLFNLAGSTPVNNIAKWDGASWSDVGGGVAGTVTSLTVFDPDGSGTNRSQLIVGGSLFPQPNIVRWDGDAWTPVGSGTNATVSALHVFDLDAAGANPPRLIVAGSFTNASGVAVEGIAVWDGQNWSAFPGGGTTGSIGSLTTFDPDGPDAEPANLIAGGSFTTIGGVTVNNIGRWNGTTWADLDGGTNSLVGAVFGLQGGLAGSPPTLFAGGFFSTAGGVAAARVAAWVGCATPPCPGDFDGDGAVGLGDLALLLANYGVGAPAAGDIDGDSDVDLSDLTLFLSLYGSTCA